jgi:hypothetical protein
VIERIKEDEVGGLVVLCHSITQETYINIM